MKTLKFLWRKALNKELFWYLVHIKDEEIYKSELFSTQQESQDDAASKLDLFSIGLGAVEGYTIEGASIEFTFEDKKCPKEIVN